MKNFKDLFVEELKEIYSVESQCYDKMNEVLEKVKSEKLKEALKGHITETQSQIKRLEQVAEEIKADLSNSSCEAMNGLWKEWEHYKAADYEEDVLDVAIIAYLQKVKHYEIASYGSLKSYAKQLEYKTIEDLLQESIKEEGEFDKKLTEVAEGTMFGGGVNAKACKKCA